MQKKKNLVVLAMSTLPTSVKAYKFIWDGTEKEYDYYGQLEPISTMIREREGSLDKVIILATEEGEQEYANVDAIPENLLDAEMIVSAIEARDSKIVLYLKKNEIVKNDLNADWVKEEVGRTGVEPGFF